MKNKVKKWKNKPMILIIIDGWGIAPPSEGNAITLAKTPTMTMLSENYPYTQLCASGECVGLMKGQDGNSEAGHLNIGAGRIVDQDVLRINKAIADGTFFKNPAFLQAIKHVRKNNSYLHLMGMISDGMSAHSHPSHLEALLKFTRDQKINEVYLHLFTDGRDSPPHGALTMIKKLEPHLKTNAKIATIMGRYYGMDRKKNWPVTEKAYDILTSKQSNCHSAHSVTEAITENYNRNDTDEFMEPYLIYANGKMFPRICSNDSVIFYNLRSDRARQITKALVQPDFEQLNPGSFRRKNVLKNLSFVAMTDFGPDLNNILSAYPSIDVKETLAMQLRDLRQIYIAETEKYAHVTYFFNGGYADTVAGETRIIVDSPDVKTYDKAPEMSSKAITNNILKQISMKSFDFITVNYAAPDMIAHTGNLAAGIIAVASTDRYLGQIIKELNRNDLRAIITADHGNAEEMINLKTKEVDTEHSNAPVPFILFDKDLKGKKHLLREQGILGDIAPTILELFNKEKPKEMTGKSLFKK